MKLAIEGDRVKTSGGRTGNHSYSLVAGFAALRQLNNSFSTLGF